MYNIFPMIKVLKNVYAKLNTYKIIVNANLREYFVILNTIRTQTVQINNCI